jgi:hypothetical protein
MSETVSTPTTPNTPTVARPTPKGGGHWYSLTGEPVFQVPKKSGKPGEMRNTTLADARKLNLLPSVTTILKILHKEALVNWKIEQTALAVLTTPRLPNEPDDAFVHRVLHVEEQQEQEGQIARDKGIAIHDAIESYFNGKGIPADWAKFVNAPINAVLQFGEKASSEVIFVGDDYAGMGDLVQDCLEYWNIWDFKSTKKLPDPNKGGAWSEHRLQLSAYAKAWQTKLVRAGQGLKPIVCRNLYISTESPGEYVICEHENWERTYEVGFAPLIQHWQWANDYRPENPNREVEEVSTVGDLTERLRARIAELERELANPVPQVSSPQQQAPTPLPPAMARPPAQTGGLLKPVVTPPTPKLPGTTKDGRRIQWDNGVPTQAQNEQAG